MVIILILQNSFKKLFEEDCQCLNTINILQIALIITKYINKTYQDKYMSTFESRVSKREIIETQIEHTRYTS